MDFSHKLNLLVLALSLLCICCIARDYMSHTCREQQAMCLDSMAHCNLQCRGDPLCRHRISTRRRCNREYCHLLDFECVHEERCIPRARVCDGRKDCRFGSDELDCDRSGRTEFPGPSTSPDLIIQELSTSASKISVEPSTYPNLIIQELSTLASKVYEEPSTSGHRKYMEYSTTTNLILQEPSESASTIHQEPSKHTIPIIQDTSTSSNTILPQSSMSIDTISPDASIKTSAIFRESCPDNYCMQNADCVSFLGQYHCNCPPSFTGKWCEIQLNFGQDVRHYTLVISIAGTTILLCLAVAWVLIYLYRRSPSRYPNVLGSKTESQLTLAFYAKE